VEFGRLLQLPDELSFSSQHMGDVLTAKNTIRPFQRMRWVWGKGEIGNGNGENSNENGENGNGKEKMAMGMEERVMGMKKMARGMDFTF